MPLPGITKSIYHNRKDARKNSKRPAGYFCGADRGSPRGLSAAGVAFKHFSQQGQGHLVGISSIAALRGGSKAPAYNASKAFMSNYLEGLRKKAFEDNVAITVTDIQPGFVDTAMAQHKDKFWVASPKQAAEQIYTAIRNRKKQAYITHRWRLVGWLLKVLPNWLYQRI